MAIAKGDYFRLITPTFLHGNILHLLLNNLALNNLGPMVEKLSGHGRFAAVYGAAAIAGSTTSYFFSKADLSLGSSGDPVLLMLRPVLAEQQQLMASRLKSRIPVLHHVDLPMRMLSRLSSKLMQICFA